MQDSIFDEATEESAHDIHQLVCSIRVRVKVHQLVCSVDSSCITSVRSLVLTAVSVVPHGQRSEELS